MFVKHSSRMRPFNGLTRSSAAASWYDVMPLNPAVLTPGKDGITGQFGAVVADYHTRQRAEGRIDGQRHTAKPIQIRRTPPPKTKLQLTSRNLSMSPAGRRLILLALGLSRCQTGSPGSNVLQSTYCPSELAVRRDHYPYLCGHSNVCWKTLWRRLPSV